MSDQVGPVEDRWMAVWTVLVGGASLGAAIAAGAPQWTLVAIPSLTAAATFRSVSGLVRVYLGVLLIEILIAPRLDTVTTDAAGAARATSPYVALWIIVVLLGGTLSAAVRVRPWRLRPVEYGNSTALVIAAIGLVAELDLLTSNSSGVTAQLAGGSSGGGYAGLIGSVGALMGGGALLATWARRDGRIGTAWLALGLVVANLVVTVLQGFRGAAPLFLLALVVCWPRGGRDRPGFRRRETARVVATGAAILVVFLIGANVRSSIAEDAGSSGGAVQQQIDLGNLLPTVLARLDLVPALATALDQRNDAGAKAAVDVRNQLDAGLPRFLVPDKAPVSYGAEVSHAFFGLPEGTRSSSTITTLGDGIVNVGVIGAAFMIFFYILLLDLVWRRTSDRTDTRTLALRCALIFYGTDIGSPTIILTVSILRVAALMWVLFWIGGRLAGATSGTGAAGPVARPVSRVSRSPAQRYPAAPDEAAPWPADAGDVVDPPYDGAPGPPIWAEVIRSVAVRNANSGHGDI